jgi:3-methylcrotonyl-CoA carboxylase alpha subunit
VEQGASVIKGQRLIAVEAMKMEHGLSAPFGGVVTELAVKEGAQVSEGDLLLRIESKNE